MEEKTNESVDYVAPAVVCEGNLEIQAGSPLSVVSSDFEDMEF